jgi:NADH dehydrogenase/NADH:ubiquinone oxidoreductase subunit G
MVNLKINGRDVQAQPEWTVLKAAQNAGITIPTLCNHKDLSPTGACACAWSRSKERAD